MKKIQRNFRNENYLVAYIDLSSSNAYQTNEFSRESVIELIYDQITAECREFGITILDKKIEKYIKIHDITLKDMINIKGYPVPLFGTKKNYKKLANFVMELPNTYMKNIQKTLKESFCFFMNFK